MSEFQEALVFERLKHHLPTQAALKDFVHHNPLHSFQNQEFFEAIFSASKIFGIKTTFNLNEYRNLHAQGRIKSDCLDRVLTEEKGAGLLDSWKEKMLSGDYPHTYRPRVGRLRARWKPVLKCSLDDRVQPFLFRLMCSYLD